MEKNGEKPPSVARGFLNGVRTGAPIALGYIPSAVAFGILAKTASLTIWECLFMSAVVFAGASQFVAVNLCMVGAAMPEIVLTTWVLNLRHVMMSSALAKRFLPSATMAQKAWMCFEMTDESFSVAAMQKEEYLSHEFEMGLNLPGHFTWTFGSILGWFGTAFLPDTVQNSMGIAIYALFIGRLIPAVKGNKAGLIVTAAAMALSAYVKWVPCISANINKGLAIMLTAGLAALLGAVIFPLRRRTTDD